MTKRILSKIEQLATKVADEAFLSEKLSDKIDALKVVIPIYTLLQKGTAKAKEEGETTMAGLQAELEAAENGREVQHRRGRHDA